MSNKFKDIHIKNCTYYFYDDMINIKNLNQNKVKIDEKSYKNILIYYIGYVTIEDLRHVKINSVNLLCRIIVKLNGYFKDYFNQGTKIGLLINGYFEEINGNKYLTLVSSDGSKDTLKKNEELWTKIKDPIRSKSKKERKGKKKVGKEKEGKLTKHVLHMYHCK